MVVSAPIHVAEHVVVATTNKTLVRDLGWNKVACSVMVNITNIITAIMVALNRRHGEAGAPTGPQSVARATRYHVKEDERQHVENVEHTGMA